MNGRILASLGAALLVTALSFACGSSIDGGGPAFDTTDGAVPDARAPDGGVDGSGSPDAAPPPPLACVALAEQALPASPIAWTGIPACARDGFCSLHPSPTGTRPYRIRGVAGGSVWAAAGDVVYQWSGASGRVHKVPVSNELTSVAPITDSDVWATGHANILAHWDGAAWKAETLPLGSALAATFARATNDVWTVGNFGVVGHYDGAAWSAQNLPGSPSLGDVWAAAANDAWAVSDFGDGGIWHYDGTWTKQAAGAGDRWQGVWGSGPNDVWIVGEKGLLRGSAAALAPTAIPTANRQSFGAVWGTGPADVWVADGADAHHWNGSTWTKRAGAGGAALTGRGADDVYALSSTDVRRWSGATWESVFSFAAPALHAIWRGTDVWAVGAKGTVLRGREGKVTRVPVPAELELRAVWGSSDADVWFAGDGDVALHADGAKVCAVPLPRRANVAAISGSGPDDVWAVDADGAGMHWDGKAWTTRDDVQKATAILAFAPDDVWAGGKQLLHYDGVAWTEPPHDWTDNKDREAFLVLAGTGPRDVWSVREAFFEGIKIVHFDGSRWTTMTTSLVTSAKAISAVSPTDVWVFDWEVQHLGTGGWKRESTYSRKWMEAAVATPAEIWYVGDNGEIGRKVR